MPKEERKLIDLVSIGPAMLEDFELGGHYVIFSQLPRFLRNDLLRVVTRLMNAFHNFGFMQRRSNGIDVWDLHENEGGSLLSRFGQRVRRIRLHALVRLVHQLNTAVVNRRKPDVITFGNLNGGFESEPLSPKLQAWLDGFPDEFC
jgi:hypothetical protein